MGGSTSSEAFNYDQQLLNDGKSQSVDAENKNDGPYNNCTVPRRSGRYPDRIYQFPFEDEKDFKHDSLWALFQRGVRRSADRRCLGTRVYTGEGKTAKRGKYFWETYASVSDDAKAFGSGLCELGARPLDNVGIFSVNRAEWVVAALGMYSQNLRVVSLYATLGEDAVEYICGHSELQIVVSSKENMSSLIKSLPKIGATGTGSGEHKGTLRYIIQFDPDTRYGNSTETVAEDHVKAAAQYGVEILSWSAVKEKGKAANRDVTPPAPDDLAMIMYTSGTTGQPKGAMLRHGNIVSCVCTIPMIMPLTEDDCHISYLPLAHIFETVVQVGLLACGAAIGFFQGDVKKLTDDFKELQPTILCGVPRVFTKVYQKVFSTLGTKNCIQKYYFNKAYEYQCEALRTGQPRDPKYDERVFIPLRTQLGLQKCRIIITGAAPCPPYLMEFLRVAIGAAVLQGYGMTESAAAISLTGVTDPNMGHVGPPLPCNEVKLEDVPEMNYTSRDKPYPRGEICIRGPNVFAGYFKNESATRETIVDGWLHTGDVGRFNPNGTISIIDRKKNIFKIAHGEYIAAEKIEMVYGKSHIVSQIWVYGNSYKSFIVCVVVPSAEPILEYCLERKWWPRTKEETKLGSDEFRADFEQVFAGEHGKELKAYVHAEMKKQEGALKGFEKVQDIVIEARVDSTLQGFTEINECLTPTYKLRRPFLVKRYLKPLKDCYAANGEAPTEDEKWGGD